jgi:phage tail-like protein
VSRALVPGLASPHPLGDRLPALYLEDRFTQRLTGALDEVLAPVLGTLDNLGAYLDPDLAPEDFLQWLGGWVGLALDETLPVERRRAVLTRAIGLYRVRGTARGLAAHLELLTGAAVEIAESGGTASSTSADAEPPGSPGYELVVRVRVDDATESDVERLAALVAAAKPAHVVHRVEILPAGAPDGGGPDAGPPGDPGRAPPARPEPRPEPESGTSDQEPAE